MFHVEPFLSLAGIRAACGQLNVVLLALPNDYSTAGYRITRRIVSTIAAFRTSRPHVGMPERRPDSVATGERLQAFRFAVFRSRSLYLRPRLNDKSISRRMVERQQRNDIPEYPTQFSYGCILQHMPLAHEVLNNVASNVEIRSTHTLLDAMPIKRGNLTSSDL